MQEFLIFGLIVAACFMGARIAISGPTTRNQILQRDGRSLPPDHD